jgi:hypothetical protein
VPQTADAFLQVRAAGADGGDPFEDGAPIH